MLYVCHVHVVMCMSLHVVACHAHVLCVWYAPHMSPVHVVMCACYVRIVCMLYVWPMNWGLSVSLVSRFSLSTGIFSHPFDVSMSIRLYSHWFFVFLVSCMNLIEPDFAEKSHLPKFRKNKSTKGLMQPKMKLRVQESLQDMARKGTPIRRALQSIQYNRSSVHLSICLSVHAICLFVTNSKKKINFLFSGNYSRCPIDEELIV